MQQAGTSRTIFSFCNRSTIRDALSTIVARANETERLMLLVAAQPKNGKTLSSKVLKITPATINPSVHKTCAHSMKANQTLGYYCL
jgi:hypothetical protein